MRPRFGVAAAAAYHSPAVVVVGSCMIDMIAYTPRLPKLGETIHGTAFKQGFGGKGANQAVQAALLGVPTAMVGKVGADGLGASTIENFAKFGVDAEHVHRTPDAPSGVAPITVNADGGNCIVIVAGANLLLTAAEVEAARPLIEAAKVVVCQLEVTNEATLAALRLARASGATAIFNPAPAREDLEPELLAAADIVCPNETETELLTGMPTGTIEECEAAAQELRKRGAGAVLMTIGAKGSLYVGEDFTHHEPADPDVKPLDTTGAGDSFVGSFSAFLSRGLDVREAMKRATVVAESGVQRHGTQTSFAGRDDLPSWLFDD